MDELYKTGKTTFRDDQLVHNDYVVEFNDLVGRFALDNVQMLAELIKGGLSVGGISGGFYIHARDELKQLCIDYYGDE